MNKLEPKKIDKFQNDIGDQKKLDKLIRKINDGYSKYVGDSWLGFIGNQSGPLKQELNINKIEFNPYPFKSEEIISSWIRDDLFKSINAQYFPLSDPFGNQIMPNKVAIFKDPESEFGVIHLFVYDVEDKFNLKSIYDVDDTFVCYCGAIWERFESYSQKVIRSDKAKGNNQYRDWKLLWKEYLELNSNGFGKGECNIYDYLVINKEKFGEKCCVKHNKTYK